MDFLMFNSTKSVEIWKREREKKGEFYIYNEKEERVCKLEGRWFLLNPSFNKEKKGSRIKKRVVSMEGVKIKGGGGKNNT